MSESQKRRSVVVIGAGPAGLTAAYLLAQKKIDVLVLEVDPTYVGGISKTVVRDGFHFDIGGHRFFSKSKKVEDFWAELLPDDMLERPRSSRIFYRDRFFSYPLKAFEALFQLGVFESLRCVLSYLYAKLFPIRHPKSFEDWVTNQFGKRLFGIFFKTYTEKVWGMSCKDISADWAAQRIQGLSLFSAVVQALIPRSNKGPKDKIIKTLINTFRYPRKGPGMLWEACARKVRKLGGEIVMGAKVTRLELDPSSKKWTVHYDGHAKVCDHVISSAAIRDLMPLLDPPVSTAVSNAANDLKYRDFITVVLVTQGKSAFEDNWIYIHDPRVKVGRVQNFKSWSPEMLPDPKYQCYGLEYFCFEGDNLWCSNDEQLLELAKAEFQNIGLLKESHFDRGYVVRQAKAYPVYDDTYSKSVAVIRNEIKLRFPGLHLVGRNGMHKYNNQDHAVMTSMLTVENIVAGEELYDVWQVNQDAEYHEGAAAGSEAGTGEFGLRNVPMKLHIEEHP